MDILFTKCFPQVTFQGPWAHLNFSRSNRSKCVSHGRLRLFFFFFFWGNCRKFLSTDEQMLCTFLKCKVLNRNESRGSHEKWESGFPWLVCCGIWLGINLANLYGSTGKCIKKKKKRWWEEGRDLYDFLDLLRERNSMGCDPSGMELDVNQRSP